MKASLLRKIIVTSLLAFVLAGFGTGCRNTADGVGKDVENAGEKIQEKVN